MRAFLLGLQGRWRTKFTRLNYQAAQKPSESKWQKMALQICAKHWGSNMKQIKTPTGAIGYLNGAYYKIGLHGKAFRWVNNQWIVDLRLGGDQVADFFDRAGVGKIWDVNNRL